MGSKTRARELMARAASRSCPARPTPVETVAGRAEHRRQLGYPVAVKAAGGGGGKGFRVAPGGRSSRTPSRAPRAKAATFFGDPTLYLERYISDPRHVEVQVLADSHGAVVHLGERDCSIQRRHQKLIEESPAPPWVVDPAMRERIGKTATDAARAVDYRGAGTIEGLSRRLTSTSSSK